MTILYGISNCDTVKKARAWLAGQGVEHRFHDLRKDGLSAVQVARWQEAVGDALLNRRGTTWRGLPAEDQARAADTAGAQALLLAHPALVKRPVVEWPDGSVSVGFAAGDWAARLAKSEG